MFNTEVSTFHHRGWLFSSFRGPIATQSELSQLSAKVASFELHAPPLPEETYCNSFIEVACEGITLRVDALGALRRWDANQRREFPTPLVTAFDWTYSSDYGGNLSTSIPLAGMPMPEVGLCPPACEADVCDSIVAVDEYPITTPHRWLRISTGLPMARLLEREPILYYTEVVLYAGECTVKVALA